MNPTSNLMRAAVVLNSLPKKQAANLLSRLEPSDIKTVLDAIKRLDKVSAAEMSEAKARFTAETRHCRDACPDSDDAGTSEIERRLAIANSLTNLGRPVESAKPFEFLIDMMPMIRVRVLEDEPPKNIAIVLSMLPPEVASATMKVLDDLLQSSALKRFCELDEVQEDEIAQLSFSLKLRLKKLLKTPQVEWTGANNGDNLLSCSDNDTRQQLLAFMRESDQDHVNRSERSVFEIDDLEMLDDDEVKTILQHVDTSSWAPALTDASSSLQAKVFTNMAPPVAKLLSQEMSELGDIDSHTVGHARENISQVALKLARDGKLDWRKNSDRQPNSRAFPKVVQTRPRQVGTLDATSPIN